MSQSRKSMSEPARLLTVASTSVRKMFLWVKKVVSRTLVTLANVIAL